MHHLARLGEVLINVSSVAENPTFGWAARRNQSARWSSTRMASRSRSRSKVEVNHTIEQREQTGIAGQHHTCQKLLWALLPLLVASMLLTAVAAGSGVLPGDVVVARALQAVTVSGSGHLVRFTNWIGTGWQFTILEFALVITLTVARRVEAAALILAASLARSLNFVLKAAAASPRPTSHLVRISERVTSPGFPSGHVLGVTLFYGAIIYLAHDQIQHVYARRLAYAVSVFMMLATGFGRVSTGAHWPSDVLGGYLWGATLILVLVCLYRTFYMRPSNIDLGSDGIPA